MPGALFFYGVLRPGLVSGRMADLVAMLGEVGPATVSGRLHAVPDPRGHYPVMTPASADERSKGVLLIPGIGFGPAELAELDAFEGFDPADSADSDYIRRELVAECRDGRAIAADAYWWNRPIGADFIPILDGDFARYLARSGSRPLPG